MHGRFKKVYAFLMLVSFVFASVSPAFAAGITDKIFYNVGDTTDFAGHNWTLWAKDDRCGYVITSDPAGRSIFNDNPYNANFYWYSVLRQNVNKCEAEMKKYTGPQLTWDYVNGGSANYIEKHDMSDCRFMDKDRWGNPLPYDDLLYVLSAPEADKMPPELLPFAHYTTASEKDWWLRSESYAAGGNYDLATCVLRWIPGGPYTGAEISWVGTWVTTSLMIRPALQINLQSPIFSQMGFKTAPTGGKADVKVGDGFTLADYDGSNGWKLTKADSSLPLPDVSILSIMGYTTTILGKVTVNYNGPATGPNTYLSALLYDDDGNAVNYAKVADTSANGSGEVKLSFKNVLPSGWYRVKFFTERINGEGEPDYCSVSSKEYKIHVGSSNNPDDDTEANALLLPDSELPEQLKIKDEITQSAVLIEPDLAERITGVSGLTEAVPKTSLDMTVEQTGGAEDKQTAKIKILLKGKIARDKTKRLAVLIADKTENKTASETPAGGVIYNQQSASVADKGGAVYLADGSETPEQTKYTAFKAEYEEEGDFGMLSFSVPEYGKYFQSGETEIIVAELNEGAKFNSEKSSSSGCNAGFGAFALLALAGLAYKRNRK